MLNLAKRIWTKRFIQSHRIGVRVGGDGKADYIVVVLGTTKIELPYDVALKLGTWIRHAAQTAKRNAGDKSKEIVITGTLENAREAIVSSQAYKVL